MQVLITRDSVIFFRRIKMIAIIKALGVFCKKEKRISSIYKQKLRKAIMKMNVMAMMLSTATILMASNVMAYDGTVIFNGEILDSACTVDIGSSNTLMVDLGRVSKTAFVNTGDEASTTKFTLRLKDCPVSVTSAKVKFDGAHDSNDSSLLAITQSVGAANGVAIRIKTADSMSLGLNQDNGYAYMLSSTVDNNLDFYAAYVATLVPVLPGSANAVANFTVNYN